LHWPSFSALADGTTFLFQTVISPGDPAFTQLLGINNGGTIAGYLGDGTVVPNHGFILTFPSTYTPENFPGSVQIRSWVAMAAAKPWDFGSTALATSTVSPTSQAPSLASGIPRSPSY